ncbi:gluconate 2-dehydrogenase subunit 3 family protein [Microbulbifer hainanensis]|uniref:gluconate 2-dehydrogenase subunit 3 family protein n=1 Tax=Microbulbifer hainanensis TaxID=2735675 RepID=UPI00186815B0|nr:gluconate 2-dehydrogenase subunit 3 family protein [Microbulbifer hainanensis]
MTSNSDNSMDEKPYKTTLTRRESLKWLGLLSAAVAVPAVISLSGGKTVAETGKAHWPKLSLPQVTGKGYGKDPNLIVPPEAPWPLTLEQQELNTIAVLSDIIVPREGNVPSASEVKVPDVVNEWVSAPYARQQADRLEVLSLVVWLEDEAKLRYDAGFRAITNMERLSIIDDIAYKKAYYTEEYSKPAEAFSRLRSLVLSAFFCTSEGTKDIGYMGNVPIAGDYPGPTKEAMQHLNGLLDQLGLSLSIA